MEPGERTNRSGSETRQRGGIIGFRASEAERAELEAAAERAGLSLGSYIRAVLLAAPKTRSRRRPTIEQEALAQLLAQLGRVSGNVYQISRKLNFGDPVLERYSLRSVGSEGGWRCDYAHPWEGQPVIISGGSRCNWRFFARHLMNERDNARVQVAEIRGVTSDTVLDALREMDAVASGTRCKNFFYHANLNPRYGETLTAEQWEQAADILERNLGLEGHARFVVEHDKDGRVHRHIIWSRIDPDTMRAVSDSFTAREHERTSRELEEAFGLEPVESVLVKDRDKQRPDRRAKDWETFRGKHSGVDPQEIKKEVTELWNGADSGAAFAAALADHGYILCRGDRRDFCIVDSVGHEHSLARRIQGAKAADIRTRMSGIDRDALPSVEEGRALANDRLEAAKTQESPQKETASVPQPEDTSTAAESSPHQAAPEPKDETREPSVWERLALYAGGLALAFQAARSASWAVEEIHDFLRSDGSAAPDTRATARTLDDYAAPLEQAIRDEGAVPERDRLNWWQRAEVAAANVLHTTGAWARESWNSFVGLVQRDRDNDPPDRDLER